MMQTSLRPSSHEKIDSRHLERLAVVYVRQSTAQQVLNHQESTRFQYDLRERASALGWPSERVLVIDDDLGKSGRSAEERVGFQQLVSEVSLDHVGLIIGVEMSRFARSCKDWHQLLELCGLFDTLIADTDGIYDVRQYNDRLLLGLKGAMSEAELHVLRQRMDQGRLSKARRGELRFRLPAGYIRQPGGEIALDPDEQVQDVIRLVFSKFDELGTVNAVLRYFVRHGVLIGGRSHVGATKREVVWRDPNRVTLQNILNSPMYAGAYAYGKRTLDPRRKQPGKPSSGRVSKPREEWTALIRDQLPAYISWEQHERNLARMRANRAHFEAVGSVRGGVALLGGILKCGWCGRRLAVNYNPKRSEPHRYECLGAAPCYGGETCFSISGPCLDEAVTGALLRAIQPAALEVSLATAHGLEQERKTLLKLWEQRLERAAYEASHAQRQYNAVDPDNRLVARELERQWEQKLCEHKRVQEDFRRFESTQPQGLSEAQREEIRRLAEDLPALWGDSQTEDSERKTILRAVAEAVIVTPRGESEQVELEIRWVGGSTTKLEIIRPVARYEQLSYFPELSHRIKTLVATGVTAKEIAENLNRQGLRPPNRATAFNAQSVSRLIRKLGLVSKRATTQMACMDQQLGEHEWSVPALARQIGMPEGTLRAWVSSGSVKARRAGPGPKPRWIVWADDREVQKLRARKDRGAGYYAHRRWVKEVEAREKANKQPEGAR